MAKQGNANRGGIWGIVLLLILALAAYVTGKVVTWQAGADIQAAYDLMLLSDIALAVSAVFVIAAFGLGFILIITQVRNTRNSLEALLDCTRKSMSRQTEIQAVLTNVNENQLLSDAIKSIAFRRKDRDVLADAIQQDMRAEQWESALWLITQLETRFGGKREAQKLREQLALLKKATLQEKIDTVIAQIESFWIIHQYKEAQQLEDDLLSIYPENDHVKSLKGQTENRLQTHKKELLERLNKASHANDLNQSIEILKLLDSYLSPTEAAALQETARGLFKERLHNMGVQFSLLVTEKAWEKALKLGQEIIHEYPNSRMAQEVRENMDVLRQRAGL